jgi:hypothetical protein
VTGRRDAPISFWPGTLSASSRLFKLNGKASMARGRETTAIMRQDSRFSTPINADKVFGTHSREARISTRICNAFH